jgi:hypothetical protein
MWGVSSGQECRVDPVRMEGMMGREGGAEGAAVVCVVVRVLAAARRGWGCWLPRVGIAADSRLVRSFVCSHG